MGGIRKIELEGHFSRDGRGWVFYPLGTIGGEGAVNRNFHTVSMKPGAVRGNHCHEGASEWLLFCGGPATLAWRTRDGGESGENHVGGDDPELYHVPAGVEHAIRNVSDREIYLVVFQDKPEFETARCGPLLR